MIQFDDTVKNRPPVAPGDAGIYILSKTLDAGFRRHDGQRRIATFYGFIKFILAAIAFLFGLWGSTTGAGERAPLNIAVEFTDHAACAYVAMEKNMFEAAGLQVKAFESYTTGMALSAALARGRIDAAYMCLIPAINAFANGGVPLKIVSGTHLYGYGLVADPARLKTVADLADTSLRIGCMQEGSAVDVFLHKTMAAHALTPESVLPQIRRMSPEKAILALKARQISAAFIPEHWAGMAEHLGFAMVLTAREVWPGMPGSVLLVKGDLITSRPVTVARLVQVTREATDWIHAHPSEAAIITAKHLSLKDGSAALKDTIDQREEFTLTPEIILHSMQKLEYTVKIDISRVQETIDYVAGRGYIKKRFDAGDIMDLQFLQ